MKQRPVVSSFVLTPASSPGGSKVAIFHRSNDVHTYRNKWAACSGTIDPTDFTPESAARREIQEETRLTPSHFFFFRRGKPFTLLDTSLDTEWTIHPFAALLKPNALEITIDWEHTEYRIVSPSELTEYDHVPNLDVGLKRVVVGKETEEMLEDLRGDNVSGAQKMALKALGGLGRSVRGRDLESARTVEEFWGGLRGVGWHLAKNGRPSMGAAIEGTVFKALDEVKEKLEAKGGVGKMDLDVFKEMAEEVIKERIEARKHSTDALTRNFVEFIEKDIKNKRDDKPETLKIVTLSNSGTLTTCLEALIKSLSTTPIHLTILESRPFFEGVSLANTLLSRFSSTNSSQNLTIEILPDVSIASALPNTHYLLFGADKVLPSASVSNKNGTLSCAVLAKTLNPDCKVLSVFETDKVTAFGEEHMDVESGPEEEVINAWQEKEKKGVREMREKGWKVQIGNAYFEWTEGRWIDGLVTEEGVMGKEGIERVSGRSGELERRVYQDWERVG